MGKYIIAMFLTIDIMFIILLNMDIEISGTDPFYALIFILVAIPVYWVIFKIDEISRSLKEVSND